MTGALYYCPQCGYHDAMTCSSMFSTGVIRWWLRCLKCGADSPLENMSDCGSYALRVVPATLGEER